MASPLTAAGPEGQHIPDTMVRAVTKGRLDIFECIFDYAQDMGWRKSGEMPETQVDFNSDKEGI